MYKKVCPLCKENKTIDQFYKHNSTHGYQNVCFSCVKENIKKRKKRELQGKECTAVSFSGGKDSTAMLIKLIEKKIKIDTVVWFDCGSFEFPEMRIHMAKVEKMFGIKIDRVLPPKPFEFYMYKYLTGNGNIGYGWPTPGMRWCTNFKILQIRQFLTQYRPYNQMIGYAYDEMKRVNKSNLLIAAQDKKYFRNTYPLVDLKITEKKALEICKSYGFDWGGLYDVFDRVSCWCCPLQGIEDIKKLKQYYPEMYKKLKRMNDKSRTQFKNDEFIFEKIEKKDTCEQLSINI